MGAGFYLVPEASRRRAAGEDTRPVLLRALGDRARLCDSVPADLRVRRPSAADRSCSAKSARSPPIRCCRSAPPSRSWPRTYLAVQYMLALKRTAFLIAIGAVAVLEPILLLHAAKRPAPFATVVLLVQAIGALLAFGMALRRGGRRPRRPRRRARATPTRPRSARSRCWCSRRARRVSSARERRSRPQNSPSCAASSGACALRSGSGSSGSCSSYSGTGGSASGCSSAPSASSSGIR